MIKVEKYFLYVTLDGSATTLFIKEPSIRKGSDIITMSLSEAAHFNSIEEAKEYWETECQDLSNRSDISKVCVLKEVLEDVTIL